MSKAKKTHRTQRLAEMLRGNGTISNISMRWDQHDENIWQRESTPQLKVNEVRPSIVAVKKAQGTLRAPLFGRALHAVSDNDTFLL
jgi:hypothetical protein